MIRTVRLWENTSGPGDRYLVGRMGSLRVLVLENNRRDGDSDNAQILAFAEAPQRDSQPGHRPSHRIQSVCSWEMSYRKQSEHMRRPRRWGGRHKVAGAERIAFVVSGILPVHHP
jgi:hypothetical protein